MPLQATSGAASYDATGGGAPVKNYIEDVFSTWLYTGTGALGLNIPNGIDLAGKGGMVWAKSRNVVENHHIWDTVRGISNTLYPNLSFGSSFIGNTGVTAFNSNGFTLGTSLSNTNANTFASWTFREQPKFFDVVTYTGTGVNRTVAHNLGSVPGMMIVKRTDSTSGWWVYHKSQGATKYGLLESSAAFATASSMWNNTAPTSTEFTVGTFPNASGGTYVAYLFAHNAGGFGLSGTDNVITCGSYTATGGGMTIDVGYEPQLVLIKSASSGVTHWGMYDSMRGLNVQSDSWTLCPNLDIAETTSAGGVEVRLTNRGFSIAAGGGNYDSAGVTYIYMTIRRGPMRVPTNGTSVLGLNARTGTGAQTVVTGNAGVSDFAIIKNRTAAGNPATWATRLTNFQYLSSAAVTAETAAFAAIPDRAWTVMDGVTVGTTAGVTNTSGDGYINYLFERAPGFMDVACYKGTGANRTIAHNLAAVPELMIVKGRSGATAWQVYSSALANTEYLVLNTTAAKATGTTRWNSTTPTASVFSLGTAGEVNTSSATYVAYLFASAPGVSKVGGYTGTGTTQIINCGFSTGARFVLIKRTDSVDNWYYWDSARGIVAGNDPYLQLNLTSAEVTGTDWVDTAATGFELSSTAPAAINASGGTYIFLAIA